MDTFIRGSLEIPMKDGKPGGSVTVKISHRATISKPFLRSDGRLGYRWGPGYLNTSLIAQTVHILPKGQREGSKAPGLYVGDFDWNGEIFSVFQKKPLEKD